MPASTLEKSTAATKIRVDLHSKILSGTLKPGAPLREEEIAQCYSVSRHVIREVLRMLVSDGLAQYSAFKGARVAAISVDDVRDIYRARRLLEGCALLTADTCIDLKRIARIHGKFVDAVEKEDWSQALQLDLEFHHSLVDATDCQLAKSWHLELFQSLGLAHLTCPDFRADGHLGSIAEHAEIVVAIGAGEFDRAHSILMKHLNRWEERLAGQLGKPHPKRQVATSRK